MNSRQYEIRNSFLSILLIFFIPACIHSGKSNATSQGNLAFDNDYHEFGKVTEGDIIKHSFRFSNKGPGPVRLVKTRTTCGCTTADAALKEYAGGESGLLEVVIDTKGKHGIMNKTVELYLENNRQEIIELTLVAELIPPPHPVVENVLAVNKDSKCKTCHLEAGVGQKGGFLYHRVCAQCHGSRGKGASASALNNKEWLNSVDNEFIRNAVVHGLPEIGMPPYVEGVTPPLSNEQVDSLIEYVRSWGK